MAMPAPFIVLLLSTATTLPVAPMTADEQAVARAALPQFRTGQACFRAETSGAPILRWDRAAADDLPRGAMLAGRELPAAHLTTRERAAIDAAYKRLSGPEHADGKRLVPPEVYASLTSEDDLAGCKQIVSISTPAIHGDTGFISIGLYCGPACGVGRTYALVRRSGRWVVAAAGNDWVS